MKENKITGRKKILAISGSMRQSSTNVNLINCIRHKYSGTFNIQMFEGLSGIPPFNPDLDNEDPPKNISNFRGLLKEADGVLICAPEYALGVPGTLKNAIDWIVSSMELSHKPAVLITASTSGHQAHQSLIDTLRILEADIPDASTLLISHAKTKIDGSEIVDPVTFTQVEKVMGSLINTIQKKSEKKV